MATTPFEFGLFGCRLLLSLSEESAIASEMWKGSFILRLFLNQTANFGRYFGAHFFPEKHENGRSFNLNALKSSSVFHFLKNVLEFSAD